MCPLIFYAQVLIGAGAEVDAKDENGMTPLVMAAARGCGKCVAILARAGADGESTCPYLLSGIARHRMLTVVCVASSGRHPERQRDRAAHGESCCPPFTAQTWAAAVDRESDPGVLACSKCV